MAAARAWDQVVEREIVAVAAILAGEAVAQKNVEAIGRGFTMVLSETTLGSRISKEEAMHRVDGHKMFTRSRKTALIVSCQDHNESG